MNAESPSTIQSLCSSTVSTPDRTPSPRRNTRPIKTETISRLMEDIQMRVEERHGISCLPLNPNRTGAPYFAGHNVTDFLEHYEYECEMTQISKEFRKRTLPLFCDAERGRLVRAMPQRDDDTEWEVLKEKFSIAYYSDDEM